MKILEYELIKMTMENVVEWWRRQSLIARRIELFFGFIVFIGIMFIPVEWGGAPVPLFIPLMIYGFGTATALLILFLLWWLAGALITQGPEDDD